MTNSAWTFTTRKFSEASRKELIKFLKGKKLGDHSSRELFINDVESWLGLFDEVKSRDIREIRKQIEDIKKQSDKLISLLDKSYLDTDWWIIEGMIGVSLNIKINESSYKQVKENIELLRDSCEWSTDATKPNKRHLVSGKDREFISQIAQSYSRQFSKKPSPSRNSIFEQVLCKVVERSNTSICIGEKILKSVLSNIQF